MGILANENAISSGGYQISNSLRFQSASSTYASRTTGTSTSATTWTWSAWVKRGQLGTVQALFSGGSSGTASAATTSMIFFDNTDILSVQFSGGATSVSTSAVYRDPAAWYHIVVKVAATTATIYVNNTQVATGTVTPTYINAISTIQYIGYQNYSGSTRYFDGYQTEVNFIDGQALTPSSFGSTDATSGQWVAAKYTGTYGTNGFYLPFSNGTSTTTLGADSSGNSNNWTLTNFTRSAGVSDCWMYDVPSGNGGASGTQPNSNYAVLSPIDKATPVLSNSNLQIASQSGGGIVKASIYFPTTGKWYLEWTYGSSFNNIGIATSTTLVSTTYAGSASTSYAYYSGTGQKVTGGTSSAYGSAWNTAGVVIGVAFDADNGTLTFYRNNVSQGTAFSGLTGNQYVFIAGNDSGIAGSANFGQRSFAYTPPSGYQALCTANLPVATIKQGNKYMDATLYTGNSSTVTATNAGAFKPDLVWVKDRSQVASHVLTDSVRGTSAQLFSNLTNTEQSNATYITSFNSNGFSVGQGNGGTGVANNNGDSFVGWQWQAGQGSTSSNTNGSITSTTSVNATAGFSIVTWTGNGVGSATVGHGLGVAPAMVISKGRSYVNDWWVGHKGASTGILQLNSTNAVNSSAGTNGSLGFQQNYTSTVFGFNNGSSSINNANQNGITYVAYCFAEIAGFSKFGSYTGNGSADGTFVYLGFRPKFVLIKASSQAGNDWQITDTSRSPYNAANAYLYPDLSNAEGGSSFPIDILSNGFKLRNTTGDNNNSGVTFIFAAFAESPFASSNAR